MSAASPLWYITRGAGMVTLIFLTLSFVLGILTTGRYRPPRLPRFINSELHRNVALGALLFATAHVATAILDPFAKLGILDAAVPFSSAYRPLWLGLGVVSGELFLVLVATSLVRERIGHSLWRAIHWAAYAAWPLAIVHGFGTGSDEKAWWAMVIYLPCVAAVVIAIAWRLLGADPESRGVRNLGGWALSLGVLIFGFWVVNGPLQPGWAQAAGTPAPLLKQISDKSATATTATTSRLAAGLDHALVGQAVASGSGIDVDFADQTDPSYQIVLSLNGVDSSSGRLRVSNAGSLICDAAVHNDADGMVGSCAGTRVNLANLQQDRRGVVTADLVTG
jgi:methionine sulfoxide reductase heme-binding subunit